MFYYLYEVRNKLNNKIYVGVHRTKNLDDGYMGSGSLIVSAISKYGLENFSKIILEYFDTSEAMYAKEAEVVNEAFLSRPDVYNLKLGGAGGWDHLTSEQRAFTGPHSVETKQKISKSKSGKPLSEEHKLNLSKNNWAKRNPDAHKAHAKNAGRLGGVETHTAESKNKIGESLRCRNKQNAENGIPHPLLGFTRAKIVCPYCAKEGAAHVMFRWHFEKCKLYPGGI